MHFLCLIFPEILILFSWWMTGDFSRNVQRRCFYGVLGDVASRGFVGPP